MGVGLVVAAIGGVLALTAPAPAMAQNLVGPCVDGHRWEAVAIPGDPVATYSICRVPQEFVTLRCGAGRPEMTIMFSFEGVLPGQHLRQIVEVDDQPIFVTVMTRPAPDPGAIRAVIPVEGDLMAALAAGNRLSVQIGQTRVGMHLAASSAALDVMSRLC
jgi:hypothetical protein